MVLTAIHVAELEVLRAFRRRETFWLWFLAGTFLMFFLGGDAAFSSTSYDVRVLEMATNTLRLGEAALLFGVTFLMASRSVGREFEAGSWVMLTQTPNRMSRLYLGKALGVAATAVAFHGFCYLPLLIATPVVRKPHLVVLGELLAIWLFALGYIPEGMLLARITKEGWQKNILFRMASVVRVLIPIVILYFLIAPESSMLGSWIRIWNLLWSWLSSPVGPDIRLFSSYFVHPWAPAVVVLGWQLLSSIPYCLLLLRRGR